MFPYTIASRQARMPRLVKTLSLSLFGTLALTLATMPMHAQFATAAPTKAKKGKSAHKDNGKRGRQSMVQVDKPVVLVFPPDTKGGPSDQLVDVILDVEKGRLIGTQKYGALTFNANLSSVRRALNEQSIASTDTTPPFDSLSKSQKLASLTGYKYVLTTSLDDYQYDADKQQITVIMTVKLVDFTGTSPRIVSIGDSASSAPKAARDANDIGPALDVTRSLTEKLMTQVLSPTRAAAPAAPAGTPPSPAPK